MDYQAIADRFYNAQLSGPLFRTATNPDRMWESYLNSFDNDERKQEHNCSACREFIKRYGGIVSIDTDGAVISALWKHGDQQQDAMLSDLSGRVTNVFFTSSSILGKPVTGRWTHMHARPSTATAFPHKRMMEERHKFENVLRALNEYPAHLLNEAVRVLESGALPMSHHVVGQARWLANLQQACIKAVSSKNNLIWNATARAPEGFCHPRGSMLGTLLEDILSGKKFEAVKRSFAAKTDPLKYQRPVAPPTAGAVAQAEKLFEEMKLAPALARRFARTDEITAIWRAPVNLITNSDSKQEGIFAHLLPQKDTKQLDIPAQPITWVRFRDTILPNVERIEFFTPHTGNYAALLTAVHADAPQLFQWPHPFSWYVWHGGSQADSWKLKPNAWINVTHITINPAKWGAESDEAYAHQGNSIIMILEGAQETRMAGAAIFPQLLRKELHGVRSVIEAYSNKGSIAGLDQPMAAGYLFGKGGRWSQRIRVYRDGKYDEHILDRWE